MNQCIIGGYVARDPEIRFTQTGKAIAMFTVAASRGKDKGADFISCVAWEKMAEAVGEHVKKGTFVVVIGKIQTRSYESNGQKRYVTEILAHSVTKGMYASGTQDGGFNNMGNQVDDEEIPF